MIFQIIVMLVVFGLLLLTSFLLHKFGKNMHYGFKFIIKLAIYIISFSFVFVLFRDANNLYTNFTVAVIFVTYSNKYISKIFKKLNFGFDNDYRIEMLFFLLFMLVTLFQGNDILKLGVDIDKAMNMVWITILVEQIINQFIINNIENKKSINLNKFK